MASGEMESSAPPPEIGAGRFPTHLMVAAARLYYLEDATQAEIARRLGTSRASVSRLLSEARRQGIVRIQVIPPASADHSELAGRTAQALGLRTVHVVPAVPPGRPLGPSLAPAVSAALTAVDLQPGDVVLVSSGRTIHEIAQSDLPQLPGIVLAPTVGGQDEPEAWYQTNEITREMAAKVGGSPAFLYAPALPGPDLYRLLLEEPQIRRILDFWAAAKCALLGVGPPPLTRRSIPRYVTTDAVSLRESVGDVCTRFFDNRGRPVEFPGSERLIATPLDVLRRIPATIAVAVGRDKTGSIIGGARGGYFNQLVTDTDTAQGILDQLSK